MRRRSLGIVALLGLLASACGAAVPDATTTSAAQASTTSPPAGSAANRTPDPAPVPEAHMAVIRQQLEAINARAPHGFIQSFLAEGVFEPGGDFAGSSSFFGNSLAVADTPLVQAWMAINTAWGLEAQILGCNKQPDAAIVYGYGAGQGEPMVVTCEVATRWHTLAMEITQTWNYEFHGSRLGHWGYELRDLHPSERTLPLGYDGLLEWESWLDATNPALADRYLNARAEAPCRGDGCQEWWDRMTPELAPLLTSADREWSIQGHRFFPYGLIPYDPAFAHEIEASIRAYLDIH